MNMTNIYALLDPRTQRVRYIGKANNIIRRMRRHLKMARGGQSDHKSRWLASLLRIQLVPQITILETCNIKSWKDRECYWINHYRPLTDLTNAKDGGDGLDPDEITRAKMSAARRGRPPHNKGKITPIDTRARQSIAAQLRWKRMTETERAYHIARMRSVPSNGQHTKRGWHHTEKSRAKIGAANARARTLTIEQARQSKTLIEQGVKSILIARRIGINVRTVYSIKYGEAYRDV